MMTEFEGEMCGFYDGGGLSEMSSIRRDCGGQRCS